MGDASQNSDSGKSSSVSYVKGFNDLLNLQGSIKVRRVCSSILTFGEIRFSPYSPSHTFPIFLTEITMRLISLTM